MTESLRARQVVQHLRSGTLELLELPVPRPNAHEILIETRRSLLSAGTERMLLEFGRAGLLGKALQQPDRVRLVLDRLRTEGIAPTLEATFNKLDEPLPLGYSNVGVAREIGAQVHGFSVGDRVVSNAAHTSWARVGVNLCARIPDSVDDDQAAFVVPAAIGMQGVRLAQPTLGETFGVIGVGLIGLLTIQLLQACGCRVVAIDIRADRLALAQALGASTVLAGAAASIVDAVRAVNYGRELDAVLITAATDSDAPVRDAAQMTRKRGRIVLVGVAGLRLSRADFYAKELSLQVSCSYGPGRYDPLYESGGQDYPLPFVRWTEQRNFEAVLELLGSGRLNVRTLVSHRFDFGSVTAAYDALLNDGSALGILLEYGAPASPAIGLPPRTIDLPGTGPATQEGLSPGVLVIGAGAYARRFLLPALRFAGARLVAVAANGSVLAGWSARKFAFRHLSSDVGEALQLPGISAVVVATRHNSHARYVCQALQRDKHVFVEKPLALSADEIGEVEACYQAAVARGVRPILMVGFNRRFAPLAVELRRRVGAVTGPKSIIYTVNAGSIPADHWTQDPEVGGGRIVGEACHFIDFARYLIGASVTDVRVMPMGGHTEAATPDSVTITLCFAEGSIATVHYLANGGRTFPKERVEVFAAGAALRLDNFRSLTSYSWPGARTLRSWKQDKGNRACMAAFIEATRTGGAAPIPLSELLEVSRVSLEAARLSRLRGPGGSGLGLLGS